jgi:hypothetical protein
VRGPKDRLEIPIAATYPLAKVQDAYRQLEQRHTLRKIVLHPWHRRPDEAEPLAWATYKLVVFSPRQGATAGQRFRGTATTAALRVRRRPRWSSAGHSKTLLGALRVHPFADESRRMVVARVGEGRWYLVDAAQLC